MEKPFLQLKNISKSFGKTKALIDFSIMLNPGECIALLGPNGAGKSTCINILSGILQPTSGEVCFQGTSVGEEQIEWKRNFGVVLEDLALFDHLTVRENLEFIGSMYGIEPDSLEERTNETLAFLDLLPFEHTLILETSQGTRKKTAFGAAILHKPRVLLLDELFSSVEAISVRNIRMLLERMITSGAAILLSSHLIESIYGLTGRVLIIDEGSLKLELKGSSLPKSSRELESVYLETVYGDKAWKTIPDWV